VEVTMSTLHRAQLLLETEQHEALAALAEQEGRSMSDLVREILRDYLAERYREARVATALQALEGLAEIRTRVREEHGIYQADPVAAVRADWEDNVERLWRGEA
jgi:hypothetical protein